MTADQGRVRLRWARGSFITAPMPWVEAGQWRAALLTDIVRKGDGIEFVDFVGHDGREVSVRARDIVAVECLPELPYRVQPTPGAHVVGTVTVTSGTDFLRQRAGQPVVR